MPRHSGLVEYMPAWILGRSSFFRLGPVSSMPTVTFTSRGTPRYSFAGDLSQSPLRREALKDMRTGYIHVVQRPSRCFKCRVQEQNDLRTPVWILGRRSFFRLGPVSLMPTVTFTSRGTPRYSFEGDLSQSPLRREALKDMYTGYIHVVQRPSRCFKCRVQEQNYLRNTN